MSSFLFLANQWLDANGAVYAGAKANVYLTGTTTTTPSYQDSALTTPHTNPVVADSAGRFAPIYLSQIIDYKIVITDSGGTTLQTIDPLALTIRTGDTPRVTAIEMADGGSIKDDSANEYVKFSKTASAINEATIANAAAGSGPTISATGGDTNIDLNLSGKGTGNVRIDGDLFSSNGAGAKTLNADSNLQTWLNSAVDTLTVEASTTYEIEGEIYLNTGATTHTTSLDWDAGTCTFTSFTMTIWSLSAAASTAGTPQMIRQPSAAEMVINATSTAVQTTIRFCGLARINAGGTFIPNMKFSANPTGTNTCGIDSFIRMRKLGTDTVAAVGSWA